MFFSLSLSLLFFSAIFNRTLSRMNPENVNLGEGCPETWRLHSSLHPANILLKASNVPAKAPCLPSCLRILTVHQQGSLLPTFPSLTALGILVDAVSDFPSLRAILEWWEPKTLPKKPPPKDDPPHHPLARIVGICGDFYALLGDGISEGHHTALSHHNNHPNWQDSQVSTSIWLAVREDNTVWTTPLNKAVIVLL